VYQLAMAGAIPGGTKNNMDFVSKITHWSDHISDLMKLIICDAQTSGGLLISIPEKESENLLMELKNHGVENAAIIGKMLESQMPGIVVI